MDTVDFLWAEKFEWDIKNWEKKQINKQICKKKKHKSKDMTKTKQIKLQNRVTQSYKQQNWPQRDLWVCVRPGLWRRPTGSPSYQSCRSKSGCCHRNCRNSQWETNSVISCRGRRSLEFTFSAFFLSSCVYNLHSFFMHFDAISLNDPSWHTVQEAVTILSPISIQNLVSMAAVCLQQGPSAHAPQL